MSKENKESNRVKIIVALIGLLGTLGAAIILSRGKNLSTSEQSPVTSNTQSPTPTPIPTQAPTPPPTLTPAPAPNPIKLRNSKKIIQERTQEGFKVGLKGCARVGDKEIECYLEILNLENREITFALFGNFRPGKSTRINLGQDYLPVSVQLDGKIDNSIGYVLHSFPPEGEAQAIFKFEILEFQEKIKYFEVNYRIRSKSGLRLDPRKFTPFNDINIINEIL